MTAGVLDLGVSRDAAGVGAARWAGLLALLSGGVFFFGGRPTWAHLLLLGGAVAWAGWVFADGRAWAAMTRTPAGRLLLGWGVLVLAWAGLAAAGWSEEPAQSWRSVRSTLGPVLVLWGGYGLTRCTGGPIRMLPRVAVVGVVFVVLGLLLKLWPGNPLTAWMLEQPWQHGVPFATIDYHGNAGTLIALTAVCLTVVLVARPTAWAGYLGLGLTLVAVLVNASRIALVITPVAVLAVVGIAVWQKWRRRQTVHATPAADVYARSRVSTRQRLSISLIGLLLFLGVGAYAAKLAKDDSALTAPYRMTMLSEESSKPWYPRRIEMRSAYQSITERPWLGYGPGTYAYVSASAPITKGYFFAPPPEPGVPWLAQHHAKCDLAELVIEWGAVGGLLLVLPGIVAVGRSACIILGRQTDVSTQYFMLAIFVAFGVMIGHGIADCTLQLPVTQFVAAALVGIALAMPASTMNPSPLESDPS